MHFDLDDDERALQEGIAQLAAGPLALARLRDDPAAARDAWRALADAGVFALRLPEQEGGLGLGATHAAVVFEQLGRAAVPGPVVATHLAAGAVDGAATGATVVGLVEATNSPLLIEHLEVIDVLVVVGDDAVSSVDPRQLDAVEVERPLDPLTPLHRVTALPEGDAIGGPEQAEAWRAEGAAITAAFLVGLASATTDFAVAYAKDREQFGRPIGSFQALKHLMADMLVRTEVARAAVHAAAVHLDDAADEAAAAVSVAKLLAGEAARANGEACVQVHGGMGFTWDVDVHLYLKRAAVLATHFGSGDEHAARVAATL